MVGGSDLAEVKDARAGGADGVHAIADDDAVVRRAIAADDIAEGVPEDGDLLALGDAIRWTNEDVEEAASIGIEPARSGADHGRRALACALTRRDHPEIAKERPESLAGVADIARLKALGIADLDSDRRDPALHRSAPQCMIACGVMDDDLGALKEGHLFCPRILEVGADIE